MQPFPVTCESCRAKLRVRSRRMIGEIHSCPKCSGMVLIQPPVGWEDVPSEASAAFAAMKPASTPAKQRPKTEQPAEILSFYEVADMSGIDLTTPASVVAPPPIADSVVEHWGRRVVWGSAIGSAVILTAGFVWAMWPGGDERLASAPPPIEDEPSLGNTPQPKISTDAEPVAETVANKPTLEPEVPIAEAPKVFELPEVPQAETPRSADTSEENINEEVPPEPLEVPAAPPAPPVVDPRDLDPENLDLVLRKSPASAPAASAVASSDQKNPTDMPKLHLPESSEEATVANLEHSLAAAANQQAPETVRRGPTSAEDMQPVPLDQLLKLGAPDIETPSLPLHRAVAMLSELTAIPITLDPAALRMAGISVDHKVTIRGKGVTAEELIRTTLAGTNLQFAIRGNQLIVIREGSDKLTNRQYQIADLLRPSGPDAALLAEWIQTLVAPESWTAGGGAGQLKVLPDQLAVMQTQAVHYDALILCERLRKLRGIPLQSRYPTELLRTKPLETALASRLGQPTTFSFVTWTPLGKVFRYWEQATGLTILVDWSALADVQLVPTSTITCAVEDATWREALDSVLTPLGMAWVPVDDHTIQITSRAAAESNQYIEFYPLPKSSDAEIVVAELLKQIPDGAVVYDAVSRSLLVRADATGQRQVATQLSLGDQ